VRVKKTKENSITRSKPYTVVLIRLRPKRGYYDHDVDVVLWNSFGHLQTALSLKNAWDNIGWSRGHEDSFHALFELESNGWSHFCSPSLVPWCCSGWQETTRVVKTRDHWSILFQERGRRRRNCACWQRKSSVIVLWTNNMVIRGFMYIILIYNRIMINELNNLMSKLWELLIIITSIN
jgi:hypothetical protein